MGGTDRAYDENAGAGGVYRHVRNRSVRRTVPGDPAAEGRQAGPAAGKQTVNGNKNPATKGVLPCTPEKHVV